jgi:hypothetical protein
VLLGPNTCTELAYTIETSGATLGNTYRFRLIGGQSNLPFDDTLLGGVYVTYASSTIESTQDIRYSKEIRGGVSTTTLKSLEGFYNSIAIGVDGFPVMVSKDGTTDDLRFVKCNDTSCSSTTLAALDTVGDVGESSSVAIGSDGFPVISYYDATNFNLKLAKCNNISCSSAATSSLDGVGSGAG